MTQSNRYNPSQRASAWEEMRVCSSAPPDKSNSPHVIHETKQAENRSAEKRHRDELPRVTLHHTQPVLELGRPTFQTINTEL